MRWWIANKARSAQLAIIISYPTGVSWIIVLLKTPRKISRSLICKNNRFSTCFCLWANVYGCHIWRAWYNGSYAIMAKPIRARELHYPMIQFLIIYIFSLPDYWNLPRSWRSWDSPNTSCASRRQLPWKPQYHFTCFWKSCSPSLKGDNMSG